MHGQYRIKGNKNVEFKDLEEYYFSNGVLTLKFPEAPSKTPTVNKLILPLNNLDLFEIWNEQIQETIENKVEEVHKWMEKGNS